MIEPIRSCVAGDSPWPLVLHGAAGTGKTCAALYLADWSYGLSKFTTFKSLAEEFRRSKMGQLYWHGDSDGWQVFPEDFWRVGWQRYDFTIMDDLGTQTKASDHEYETALTGLDMRHCKPLVVTTNVGLDEIARLFDDRVASRLAGGTVVEVVGDDQRLRR